ncbi:MAG: ATP-binding protein [Lentimicrobium sp.]|nr:ATP-binding protein [Lentimicrobium sp.]
MKKISFEYKFTGIYLMLGFLWIAFSDSFLNSIIEDHNYLTKAQTYKGLFYVSATALLFFFYLRLHLTKLRNAEKKAVESDKLKTAFLQNISHEVRTPMNGIVGFAELLNDNELTPEQRKEYLNVIVNSSNRLLEVVSEILDISLIETGNSKPFENKTDLNKLLADSYNLYKPLVNKNVTLSLIAEGKGENDIILTDEMKIRQVLNHLLSNAIKFTEKGEIKFGYALRNQEINFFVEDTGIGIAPDMFDKIFERFHKPELDINKFYEGMGLGLAICKGNLQLLGGRIWVESELHKGSVFHFTIPYKPFLPSGAINTLHEPDKIFKTKFTLLVVEDEEINFKYIKELLSGTPIELIHAENGKEAVDLCRRNYDINAVLMDIKMPVMNGYEATKEIRSFRAGLPIIAQTAYAMQNEKERALSEGCNDYLSKPFQKEQLFDIMKKLNLLL